MDKETIIKLHEKYGCKYRVHTKNELKALIKKFIWCEILYHSLNWIDTSEITDMSHLFDVDDRDFRAFNFDISEWDVSNVTNMSGMFAHCPVFNKPLNKWNVSNVTDMSQMFSGCTRFNQPLD